MALAYLEGKRIPKDPEKARGWLEKIVAEEGEFSNKASGLLKNLEDSP